jgi:tRNA pseudouridine-54 N-methylase
MVVKSEPQVETISKLVSKPADKEAKSKALKDIAAHRKAVAWQVHRWPYEKRVVQEKLKLHLPRSYLAKAGEDIKTVWPGDDLNQAVHNHYMQRLTRDEEERLKAQNCANFVAQEDVAARKYVHRLIAF